MKGVAPVPQRRPDTRLGRSPCPLECSSGAVVLLLLLLASPTAFAAQLQTEPAAYVDRVMESSLLPDEELDLKLSPYNSDGWPRSLRVDYALLSHRGVARNLSRAVALAGFIDTPNYGALSLNANINQQRQQSASFGRLEPNTAQVSSWRLDLRDLPLDGGWRAHHSAGDINTGSVPLAMSFGRVFLPTSPIRGVAAQWSQSDAVALNAVTGRTGLFSGIDVADFQPAGGQISALGGQFRLPSSDKTRLDAAVQLIDGKSLNGSTGLGIAQNSRGFYAATAWEGVAPWSDGLAPGPTAVSERLGGLRVQGNLVRSSSTRDGESLGLWSDAAWRSERWRNTAGLFRFEPGLRWGAATLASDLQGVYWQADTSSRQWQAGVATELSDRVSRGSSAAAGQSVFFNANGRYRLDTRSALGASLSVRALSSPGQAVQLSWDQSNGWGQTQWRSDFAHVVGSRSTRLGVDQSWPVTFPAALNTSLAVERSNGEGQAVSTGWTWGVLGAVSPVSQWSLDAAIRGARRRDGANSLNANIGVRWQAYSNWSLSLRYADTRGQEPLSTLVTSALSAAALAPTLNTQTSRSVQLVLRYEASAGARTAPLGGLPGSGAGVLAGNVFFDANGNGRREASEAGVPGVTVTLDRRYATRTDAQGRYEFPAVAAGAHAVELSPDNVPLPWSPAVRDPVTVNVFVRSSTTQDFAVQRDR